MVSEKVGSDTITVDSTVLSGIVTSRMRADLTGNR